MEAWKPPPGTGVTTLTAGEHWDIVSGPASMSPPYVSNAFEHVAHILHAAQDQCTWLIPLGGTAAPRTPDPFYWAEISRYIAPLPHGTVIDLPHASRTDAEHDPRWVVAPKDQGSVAYVADPRWLVGDLAVATLHLGRPAERCEACPEPIWPEDRVSVVIPARPSGRVAHLATVHRACAERHDLKTPVTDADWAEVGL
ncbi:hypothetical protein [Streptomyces lydicamycinicus]|uniref:hypothetical protein n=1 Tax=Streptomyces lydicamycinicus TaxID=1546107 RepID=UPI003C2B53EF